MNGVDPKRLFLIDAAGAVFSAFMLGVVLVSLQELVGIPVSSLRLLAVIPIFFAIFDGIGYRSRSPVLFLRGIAILNCLYCVLSLSLTFQHRDSVTALGWVYIVVEVAVVFALALTQWRVASQPRPAEQG